MAGSANEILLHILFVAIHLQTGLAETYPSQVVLHAATSVSELLIPLSQISSHSTTPFPQTATTSQSSVQLTSSS